jgi:hypothetical protein
MAFDKERPMLLKRLPCGRLVQVQVGVGRDDDDELGAALASLARSARRQTGQHLLVGGRLVRHDLAAAEARVATESQKKPRRVAAPQQ